MVDHDPVQLPAATMQRGEAGVGCGLEGLGAPSAPLSAPQHSTTPDGRRSVQGAPPDPTRDPRLAVSLCPCHRPMIDIPHPSRRLPHRPVVVGLQLSTAPTTAPTTTLLRLSAGFSSQLPSCFNCQLSLARTKPPRSTIPSSNTGPVVVGRPRRVEVASTPGIPNIATAYTHTHTHTHTHGPGLSGCLPPRDVRARVCGHAANPSPSPLPVASPHPTPLKLVRLSACLVLSRASRSSIASRVIGHCLSRLRLTDQPPAGAPSLSLVSASPTRSGPRTLSEVAHGPYRTHAAGPRLRPGQTPPESSPPTTP